MYCLDTVLQQQNQNWKNVVETIRMPIVQVRWWDLEENLEEIACSFLRVAELLEPLAIETLLWGF